MTITYDNSQITFAFVDDKKFSNRTISYFKQDIVGVAFENDTVYIFSENNTYESGFDTPCGGLSFLYSDITSPVYANAEACANAILAMI